MVCDKCAFSISRRDFLSKNALGFGSLALTALMHEQAYASIYNDPKRIKDPMAPLPPQFNPKVKNVIFLFMEGGPSQVDTFDYKPRLEKEKGEPIKMDVPMTQFNNVGTVLPSPWQFKQRGESGMWVSELFPHVAKRADDLAVVRSMTSKFSEHTSANYFIHSGFGQQGRPSMGSWVTYGLGSESHNFPGFIVLDSGLIPPGGMEIFGSGFLPAAYQGSLFRNKEQPVADIVPQEETPQLQKEKLTLLQSLNQIVLERMGGDDKLEATISNYELAFRMQTAVPDLTNIHEESQATRNLYGIGKEPTDRYGRQCLVARRLIERGVRFIELLPPSLSGHDRWDQHSRLYEGHRDNAAAVDQPIAALLTDLKAKGLLDSTLVIWGGEFGRTPMAQGSNGRDHNPYGFTMWMAGGGVKGGTVYGATDDYGYYAVEDVTEIHDLHATMLHLLGIDYKQLTYFYGGRDMRLTDVHGKLIEGVLA
ncbi:DUF1501 domain-containing protein [bacterium]|nr:DUF1501 domain-containing protein [bacterium]